MKKAIFIVIALAVLLAFQAPLDVPAQSAQKMAVPSYFYPGAYWTQLINGAPTVGLAIINPANGPGTRRDRNYLTTVRQAQAQGIAVLGYVYTRYGSRSISAVRADIDKYYSWYGVDGIFFDEASDDCAKVRYYRNLYNYVKAKGKRGKTRVVLNPGTNTRECYINASDILVTFEDDFAAYTTWSPSGWEYNYPAERFWHLILNTSEADMPQAVAWSKQRHAGWVYVTDDNLPDPWDTLPAEPYWSNELNAINQP